MRRLVLLVSAIVLVDTMFYAAIVPLLPYYSGRLDLSKAQAGLLTAAYPAGTLLASIPAGLLVARAGARATVLTGLALMGGACIVFGFAESAALLEGARFVQGVGSAASWSGALAWLVAAAPPARRGEVIGTAFGAAVGGQLLGPVVGAVARAAGPAPVFSTVAALNGVLAVLALRAAAPPRRAGEARGGVLTILRERSVAAGAGLIVLVGLFFGVAEVLATLRLDDLGAGGAAIGATWLVTAGIQAVASPFLGRWIDRRGTELAIRGGLAAGCVLSALLPWPESAALLIAVVLTTGLCVGVLWLPGMTMLSEGTERRGVDQGHAFALVNLTWAGSALLGAAGGSGLAQATSDAVPYLLLACMFAVALGAALLRTRPAVTA